MGRLLGLQNHTNTSSGCLRKKIEIVDCIAYGIRLFEFTLSWIKDDIRVSSPCFRGYSFDEILSELSIYCITERTTIFIKISRYRVSEERVFSILSKYDTVHLKNGESRKIDDISELKKVSKSIVLYSSDTWSDNKFIYGNLFTTKSVRLDLILDILKLHKDKSLLLELSIRKEEIQKFEKYLPLLKRFSDNKYCLGLSFDELYPEICNYLID